MMKVHTLKVWIAVAALSYCSVAWTFVVICQVKCLTFRSRSRSKVKLTSWGHKLGQTDNKGHRDLRGHKVGHGDLNDKLGQTDHKGHSDLWSHKVDHGDLL